MTMASELTCKEFKIRLAASIIAGGDKVAQIREYRPASDVGVEGSNYRWNDIVGLEGILSCGKDDEFGNFSAEIDYANIVGQEKAGEAGVRLTHLAVATTCALTSSPQSDCYIFAMSMAERATQQFKRETERGERLPVGDADVELFKDVDAEFNLKPGNVFWMIGPENQHDMKNDRLPLSPSRRDAD